MRKLLRKLTGRAIDAGRVAAGDDDRALFAEGLPHDLNETLARRERWPDPFAALDEPIDQRMRRSDDDEDRLTVRRRDRPGRFGNRQRDAGRLESKPGGEIDDAVAAVGVSAQHDVDAI